MDGVDHILANPLVPAIIRDVNENADIGTMVHSTLPDFIDAVRSEKPELQTIEGELRWSNRQWKLQAVLAGVMSSRINLKQANHEIEALLEKWAEPFAAIAWTLGKEHPTSYLALAWKYLLQNHPHDSICGCSLDQVHKDMICRFDQARMIAEPVAATSIQYIAAKANTQHPTPNTQALIVFNPLSWERSEVVDAEVNLPNDWHVKGIKVVDSEGDEVPFQVLDQHQGSLFDQEWYDIPTGTPTKFYKIAFLAGGVPSVGYKTFYVQALDTPYRPVGSLVNGPNSVENEHLILAVDSDSTLTVIDKETEEVYAGGMIFEDCGDFGDGWNYRKPLKDTVVMSIGSRAQVSLVENGPARATFKVDTVMTVPASMNPNGRERSADTTDIPFTSYVSLARGSRRVDIVTHADNTARDHRLRVLFPSGVEAQESNAESLFDVVTRPIKTMECPDWIEPMPSTHPQKSFVDVSGEGIGLTIINAGQPEFEVLDDVDRTVAITLMRSVIGGVGGPENQEGGQLIGKQRFSYAISPHKDGWQESKAWQQAWSHNVPMRAIQTGIHEGELPTEKSFVSIDPPSVVMTALKKASRENAVVLRVLNIAHSDITMCKLDSPTLNKVVQADLNEDAIESGQEWTGGSVGLGIGTRRIVTLKGEVRR
jgi:alpha-mannosidase